MAQAGHPREWLANAGGRLGEATVLDDCVALLGGADPAEVTVSLDDLGGVGAAAYVVGADTDYWPRVWGARGLRYVWDDGAGGDGARRALVAGLADEHWRVREMCAKVVAQHEVGEAADALLDLLDDEVPRVRAAAARAVGTVGEHEHLAALEGATQDPEPAVVDAVERAVRTLRRRIDAV